tara:strand:- start:4883 stop:5314 length:432 start_codon:yes stop_codon:yes gene_type:complete
MEGVEREENETRIPTPFNLLPGMVERAIPNQFPLIDSNSERAIHSMSGVEAMIKFRLPKKQWDALSLAQREEYLRQLDGFQWSQLLKIFPEVEAEFRKPDSQRTFPRAKLSDGSVAPGTTAKAFIDSIRNLYNFGNPDPGKDL